MMGRLLCTEQSEPGRKAEETRTLQTSHPTYVSPNIPVQQQQNTTTFPSISPAYARANSVGQRPLTSYAEMPPLQERSHSSYQSAQSEMKEIRSSAVSPNLKLPPILSSKAISAPEVQSVPSQTNSEILTSTSTDIKCPSLMDMRLAYENMMVSYFMPQSAKSENSSLPDKLPASCVPTEQLGHNVPPFDPSYASHSLPSVQHLIQPYNSNFTNPQTALPTESYEIQNNFAPPEKTLTRKNSSQTFLNQNQADQNQASTCNQLKSSSAASSSCAMIDDINFNNYAQQSLNSLQTDKILKPEEDFVSGSVTNVPSVPENVNHSANNEHQPMMVSGDQSSNIADMAAVLNELSMFIPPQDPNIVDTVFSNSNNLQNFTTTVTNASTNSTTVSSSVHYQYPSKSDPTWGRFSVLPPVMSSATPAGGCIGDSDNISLMSYNSVSSNAQNNSQIGMCYASFSPFSVNFSDNLPSAFASSPRYSGRSSHSGRGSRNKRALSNSPLSAEGIDLNSIIRMSPTSLIAYINGSRSSSSCVSPGSIGERTGCYGHLSARNSSSSPNSGSNSSGNRRSISYTPQTSTPGMSNSRSTQSNTTSDNSNVSASCHDATKSELLSIDENLLLMQAMQELESGSSVSNNMTFPFGGNLMHQSQLIPDCENLQVLPQDIAAFRTEDFIPFIPSILPPVHSHIQPQYQTSQPLHTLAPHSKPPPTYDQHMARKATLQKNSSSESSQPSNSSSFESSEGDKTLAGSSSTDTESNRMFACRWLDCSAVFQDQEEFVSHIEKVHVDQKKGDDFVCYWKLCPRRLHPFNARYKLLVHMRVHSGDKPNKCSYSGCKKAFSRLENLKIHLRSHTGERPYSCTFTGCTKTFSNSSDRTKHQKTHHDTKPYVCQVAGCGKRYTDPSSLRKHVKKSHPEKKEPDRKKIRGGVEEMDPKDVNECLMIQAIKPITLCDASPPEPTDSGLGRSPRGSQPASSSDHYPGLVYGNDSLCRSETGQGSSSHTSPSSHHSSPPGPVDREKLPPNNNSLRVPVLPPIVPSPTSQAQCFSNQTQATKTRPTSKNTTHQRSLNGSSAETSALRTSSALLPGTRNVQEVSLSRLSDIYTSNLTAPLGNLIKNQTRDSS